MHVLRVATSIAAAGRACQTRAGLMASSFARRPVPEAIAALNAKIEAEAAGTPLLSSSTPQALRAKRAESFTHEPRRVDESADGVPVSVFVPAHGATPRAAYLHFHGGGFILGSAFGQNDPRLQRMADELRIAVVSVEYGLSPEATWPAPLDDSVTAARWLAAHGPSRLGTDVFLIGGESAGAHLCLSTLIALREEARRRDAAGGGGGSAPPPLPAFVAANLVYGWYDLAGPSRLSPS